MTSVSILPPVSSCNPSQYCLTFSPPSSPYSFHDFDSNSPPAACRPHTSSLLAPCANIVDQDFVHTAQLAFDHASLQTHSILASLLSSLSAPISLDSTMMINACSPEAFIQFGAYSPDNFDSVNSGVSVAPVLESNGNRFSITDLEKMMEADEAVDSGWAGCGSPAGSKLELCEPITCWESIETNYSRSSSRLMIDFEDIMQEDDSGAGNSMLMGLKLIPAGSNHWESVESTTVSSKECSNLVVDEEIVTSMDSLSEHNRRQVYLDVEAQYYTEAACRSLDSGTSCNLDDIAGGNDLEDVLDILLNKEDLVTTANPSLIDTSFFSPAYNTSTSLINDETDHANGSSRFMDSLQLDNCDAFFASSFGLQECDQRTGDHEDPSGASSSFMLPINLIHCRQATLDHHCEEPAQNPHVPSLVCPDTTSLSNSGSELETSDPNAASSRQSPMIIEPGKLMSDSRKSVSPKWAGPTIYDIESALAIHGVSSSESTPPIHNTVTDSSPLPSFQQGRTSLQEEMKGYSGLARTLNEFPATTQQRSWNEEPLTHESNKLSSWTSLLNKRNQRLHRYTTKIRCAEEIVEDGYRWRKYGQKTIKNSPFPRSYYKCTTSKCKVKKQVERSVQDPRIMLITYEGLHVHHRPNPLPNSIATWEALKHEEICSSSHHASSY